MGFKYCKEGHIMDPSWKVCPVCLAPLSGWLVSISGGNQVKKFYTIHEGKSFIGESVDCEIRILHSNLARQQAYLSIFDNLCTIVDLGNGNPMKVNGIETVKTTLIDGDLIEFGETAFKIKLI